MDDKMALTGLSPRNPGGTYYLRVMIPKDLREHYGARTQLVTCLRTTDRKAAVLAGTKLRADTLIAFDETRRSHNPLPMAAVTPEMAKLLAERVGARLLAFDDQMRANPGSLDTLLAMVEAVVPSPGAGLQIANDQVKARPLPTLSKPTDTFAGLTDEQASKLAGLNEGLSLVARQQMARSSLGSVLPHVQAEAAKLGFSFDPRIPGGADVLKASLAAWKLATDGLRARDSGEVVDTPSLLAVSMPSRASTPVVASLRDVYVRWLACKKRGRDTVNASNLALVLYEKHDPIASRDVTQITRALGDAFRAWLLQQDTASKTARDRFNWLKTLLKYAFVDLELIPRQPWMGLNIEAVTEDERRAWTPVELQKLFGLPLFTRCELPRAWNAGRDAAYWVPLLGLFTGARSSELCQLMAHDVDISADIPVLKIRATAEGQRLKTLASRRDLPVHAELIRLGFLDYVASIQAIKPDGSLWPELSLREGKPGGHFSNWFNEMRRLPPLSFESKPDFHCFRHTVRTELTENGYKESIQDRITGHTVKGSVGSSDYAHPVKILREAVASINYPGLVLPRCYGRQ